MKVNLDLLQHIEDENLIKYLPQVNLTDRDKEIIERRYNKHLTYTEISKEFEISVERVRQICAKFGRKALYYERKENEHKEGEQP